MMNLPNDLPDEEKKFKIYSFQFADIDEPVQIGAVNDDIARVLLKDALIKMPVEYGLSKVISQKVYNPIEGVSKLKIGNIDYVWAGFKKAKDGWMPEQEYLASLKK